MTRGNIGDMGGMNENAGANRATDSDEATRQLNSFLRGEISAAETYRMAIDRVSQSDNAATANLGLLREIQEEHGRAAQVAARSHPRARRRTVRLVRRLGRLGENGRRCREHLRRRREPQSAERG